MKHIFIYKICDKYDKDDYFFIVSHKDVEDLIEDTPRSELIDILEEHDIDFYITFEENYTEFKK